MSDIRYNSWLHRSGTGGVYQDSSGRIGIGTSVPAGTGLHVKEGYSGLSAPNAHADTLYLENSGNAGVTIATPNTNTGYLTFADPEDDNIGQIIYRHNGNSMGFFVNAAERLRIDTNGHVGITSVSPVATRFSGTVSGLINLAGTKPCVYISETDNKDSGGVNRALYMGLASGTAYAGSNAPFSFATGDTSTTERVRIRTDGRVSIASSVAVAGVCTAAAFIPSMGQLSHRNLIINGAMAVNQYGTSSTSSGIKHIDRWAMYAEGANTTLTQSKSDVAAGTAPYQLGFRSAFKILNAGQSNSNVGGDTIRIEQHIEDQMIARSGWDYKSSSSYLTLSFWVKSSVAQDYVITLMNRSDLGTGDIKTYSQNFTVGSADTWTKITTKIPGSSSLTLDNDVTRGLTLAFYMYMGNDDTDGSHTDGAWQAYDGADLAKQQTITWWTTSNSTVEYTGVQLEVGEYATPFEHCGIDNELARCQRYYQRWKNGYAPGNAVGTSDIMIGIPLNTALRSAPSIAAMDLHRSGNKSTTISIVSVSYTTGHVICEVRVGGWTSGNAVTDEVAYVLTPTNSTVMELSAEL